MNIIDEVMKAEGWPQFTDAPADRGGPTRGGITLKTLSGYMGRECSVDELKALDEATARAIYETLFIVKPGFMRIADERVREYLIDIGVTSGPARAIRYLQRVVGAKDDGVLGSATADAANRFDPDALLRRLVAYRAKKMAADVQDNPAQIKWLEGWIARAVKPLEA